MLMAHSKPTSPPLDAGACYARRGRATLGKEVGALVQRKDAAGSRVNAHAAAAVVNDKAAYAAVADQDVAAAPKHEIGQLRRMRPAHKLDHLRGAVHIYIVLQGRPPSWW